MTHKFKDFSKSFAEAERQLKDANSGPPSPSAMQIFMTGSLIGSFSVTFVAPYQTWGIAVPVILSGLVALVVFWEEGKYRERALELAREIDQKR